MTPSAKSWLTATVVSLLLCVAALADQAVATWAARLPSASKDAAAFVTSFGTSGYMFVGSASVAVMAWWTGLRTRNEGVRDRMRTMVGRATFFFVAVATSGLIAQVIKHAVGRVRPGFADGSGPFAFRPFSLGGAFASFPSGHTTSAFTAAAALCLASHRARPVLFALAAAIGASRVIVGAHYPSDVVAGAALGALVPKLLTEASAPMIRVAILRAWTAAVSAREHVGSIRGSGETLSITVGRFLLGNRRWCLPAFAAGVFAVATPPTDLFGSELAEHVKDCCAILVAFAGLTVRALVVGFGQDVGRANGPGPVPVLQVGGMFSLCRHPLYLGNGLIFAGIFLMHGDRWTVLLGTLTYVLAHVAIARAEEENLTHTFGVPYVTYRQRVASWFPDLTQLGKAVAGRPFDLRRVLDAEYPFIGMTVVALAVAEFYEEFGEQPVGDRLAHLEALGAVILGVTVCIGSLWLAKKRRPSLDA